MDKHQLGKVAVLLGGSSSEREVSLMSGARVHQALINKGVDAHLFDPSLRSMEELKREKFDRCFIALHGAMGENGCTQGALEILGIPYTGPGVMASSIAMDKVITKRIWESIGIPTPPWRTARSVTEVEQAFKELGTIIVKAPHEGSTVGIAQASTLAECSNAFDIASKNEASVLCEKYINGLELTCAVMGPASDPKVLPTIGIVTGQAVYDFQSKYFSNDVRYQIPAEQAPELLATIEIQVKKAYSILGCRGWSRVDVMKDAASDQFYLLEINTSTGMTEHSLFPKAAQEIGMSYDDLCFHILTLATLDRWK